VTLPKTIFFTDENFTKIQICLHCFFIFFDNEFTAMQSKASSLPIRYSFHAMLLLVNVMFPSELCRYSSKPC